MRNTVAKRLRKLARSGTVGCSKQVTRTVYQNLKKEYKSNKSLQFS